jgi:hypothetical protein
MIVKCDVVACTHNNSCRCTAENVEITLTHDEKSEREYIKCTTYQINYIEKGINISEFCV